MADQIWSLPCSGAAVQVPWGERQGPGGVDQVSVFDLLSLVLCFYAGTTLAVLLLSLLLFDL